MKLPLISDEGLAQAIEQSCENLQHPEKFLERYREDASMRDAVIRTQALHLSMLLELQHRRKVHGPAGVQGFEIWFGAGDGD